jgi:phage N-6-adenine-methyltransferase
MNEIGPVLPRDIGPFEPQQFRTRQAKLDAIIEFAGKLHDWPLLAEAIDAKVDEQQRFVGWWDSPEGVREKGQRANSAARGHFVADAERDIGVTHQQVSRWRTSLAKPDVYRERLRQVAYRKAGLEVEESHRVNTGEYEWYTPERYIEAAREVMGGIDLDPATHIAAQSTVQAAQYYTAQDDGLRLSWHGRVWLNPPYAQPLMSNFVRKLISEFTEGSVEQAVMLTHNYTDTAWFHEAQAQAALLCFTRGRISFVGASGPPTQGQAFFYFGDRRTEFRSVFGAFGFIR